MCVCVWCMLYLLAYCLWISLVLLLYCPSLFSFFSTMQRAELIYTKGSRLISISLLLLLLLHYKEKLWILGHNQKEKDGRPFEDGGTYRKQRRIYSLKHCFCCPSEPHAALTWSVFCFFYCCRSLLFFSSCKNMWVKPSAAFFQHSLDLGVTVCVYICKKSGSYIGIWFIWKYMQPSKTRSERKKTTAAQSSFLISCGNLCYSLPFSDSHVFCLM